MSMVGCFFSANKMSGGKDGAQDVALTKHRLEAEPPHSLVIHNSCPEGYDTTAVRGLPFRGSDGIAGDQYSYDCLCRAGTYRLSEGDQACVSCAPGRYNGSPGAEKESQCIECHAGKHAGSEGATECDDCSAGRYSAAPGAIACIDCPVGT